jgi:hypothetical protein
VVLSFFFPLRRNKMEWKTKWKKTFRTTPFFIICPISCDVAHGARATPPGARGGLPPPPKVSGSNEKKKKWGYCGGDFSGDGDRLHHRGSSGDAPAVLQVLAGVASVAAGYRESRGMAARLRPEQESHPTECSRWTPSPPPHRQNNKSKNEAHHPFGRKSPKGDEGEQNKTKHKVESSRKGGTASFAC